MKRQRILVEFLEEQERMCHIRNNRASAPSLGWCKKRLVVALGSDNGNPIKVARNYHEGACDCYEPRAYKAHVSQSNGSATHAERGVLGGDEVYTTYQPCMACAEAMVEAGVRAIYYRDADTAGSRDLVDYLRRNNVLLYRWKKIIGEFDFHLLTV